MTLSQDITKGVIINRSKPSLSVIANEVKQSRKAYEKRHCKGAARSNPVINSIPDCFASLAMTM
ncbi:MAG: hypothetical protein LBK58_07890 [Prevotellaceae bacterium]|nr:hypothetical protein [Prevotellaceae bacterium]